MTRNDSTPAGRLPRRPDDDYSAEAAAERRDFIRRQTGARLDHVGRYSFDPATVAGNTRGKRVVAECVLPDALLRERLNTTAAALVAQRQISNLGALMASTANNGAHSANVVAAVWVTSHERYGRNR